MAENNTITHDMASRLLGITPGDMNNLVKDGIIPRVDKDAYVLPVIVREYTKYLRNPERTVSQLELADHLDMSDRNLREVLDKLGISHKTAGMASIRIAYIRHLREQAAGRATNGDLDLSTERAKLAVSQRERIDMQNAITRREYGPIDALEQSLCDCMSRVAAKLDTIPGKIKLANSQLTADELDVVSGVLADVRNDIASMDIDWFDEATKEENDIVNDVDLES